MAAKGSDLVMNPQILSLAESTHGQWCERIQLNLVQAIELHPGAPAEFSHRDRAVWQGSLSEVEYLVKVIWPLTSFIKNGVLYDPDALFRSVGVSARKD